MIPFDTVIFIGTVAAVLTFIDCFFAYIARFTCRVPYMVCLQFFNISAFIAVIFCMIFQVFNSYDVISVLSGF